MVAERGRLTATSAPKHGEGRTTRLNHETDGERSMKTIVRRSFTMPVWLPVVLVACGDGPMPPVACSTFPEQTIAVGKAVILEPCFEDPEMGALTLAAESSRPEVATVEVLGDGVQIAGVYKGTAVITVTATDADMLTAELAIQVVVPNRAPVVILAIPEDLVGTDQTIFRHLDRHFGDPDGDELVYDATSSDARIAAVSLSADKLAVTGGYRGAATVTVTATDPEGLSAATEWDVDVVDPASRFRDDFESEASLDNWAVAASTTVAIDNGELVLTGADGEQSAFVRRPWRAKDWTATARMANVTEDSWVQLSLWLTLDSRPAEAFLLQVGADPDDHWRTGDDSNWWLVAKRETSRGVRFEVVANGESAAVGDVGEMMDVTLSHVGPELSVTIADTVVFSTTDMGNGSQYSVDHLSLAVWAKLGATATGVFDRVEADGARPSVRQSTQHGSLPHHGVGARVESGAIKWLRMGTRFRRLALEAAHDRNRSTLSAKGSHEMVAGRGCAIPARHEAREKSH